MRKGWFIIPGVQHGDRTLEEQMRGVSPALAECSGKTVLDLGCAEGLIGREFARAGAARVHGIEAVADHIAVAREQCAGLPMTFEQAHLLLLCQERLASGEIEQYDIVLSLGVCHKLIDPAVGVRFSARSSRNLVLFRMHAKSEARNGILGSKFDRHVRVNTVSIMEEEGFARESVLAGPHDETVWWWRRK